MNESSWWDNAKCKGDPIELYLPEFLPKEEPARSEAAEMRCAGCPVMKECAADALDRDDRGVVRAGVLLGDGGRRLYATHLKLRDKFDLPRAIDTRNVWPKQCEECDSMIRHWASTEADFPGTVQAGTTFLCKPCARNRQKKPTACSTCDLTTRPRTASEEDFPGTVQRGTADQCTNCARRRQRREQPEEKREAERVKRRERHLRRKHNDRAARDPSRRRSYAEAS